MIYQSISKLPQHINFLKTRNEKKEEIEVGSSGGGALNYLEEQFIYLNILFKISITNLNKINLETRYLTVNPEFYYNHYNKIKVDLLIISIDKDNSHYLNLIKYIKTNNLKKIQYKKKYFQKFLFENFPHKKPDSLINYILSFFYLRMMKFFINKNIWFPIIIIPDDQYKGYKIGISSYNYYAKKSKKFNEIFQYVYSNLSDDNSKKIYKDTIYSRPNEVWKNYYNLLFKNEHYQDYLNFDQKDLINLGVFDGFEIPFFATNEITKIINVDPTGEKKLDDYVKTFVAKFNKKIFYEESFLYEAQNVYGGINENNASTNLKNIIKKYDCRKNMIIKSDIEGLEIKMLDELEEIILEYRPQLAISIYHMDKTFDPIISHLVIIPKKLILMCKKYKFFLNHYTYNRRETVFYCIPEEVYKKTD